RDRRGDPRLPRRRQDRHLAHGQRRRLLAPLRVGVRGRGPGRTPALLDGRRGQRARSGSPRLLRRFRFRPRLPRRDAGCAAVDGRAAGRHRDLDRGGGAMSRQMRLVDLVHGAPGDIVVTGLTADSRAVKPGDAFFAIGGFGTHGLRFAAQARQAGASAVLYEPPAPEDIPVPADAIPVQRLRARMGEIADQFHGRPSSAMTMVGVTGTSGKTSTVQLLAQALKLLGVDSGTIGTLGAGRYGAATATGYTTPMVLDMHGLLGALRDDG